ncbi:MAG TPA: glycosyltransferase family 4 protein [Chloroflexia bacterium]|nr:glycosyltransferase family 4 protein [Chloroflexia bacterium]
MPYRILMIAPTSFFADYGGHIRILEEIRGLQARGHQITVCTYHTGNNVPGVRIRRSLDVPWRRGVQVGSSRHKLYFDAMLGLTVLRAALAARPQIVHAHMHEGALLGYPIRQLGHLPLVFDYQGSLTGEMLDHRFLQKEGPVYRPLRWFESRINYLADAVITSSENAAGLLRREFHYPAQRIFPVTDAVNTTSFQPATTPAAQARAAAHRRELGIPPGVPVVVYLGLLAPYQGTDLLLEAARVVLATAPETRFVIMGFPGVDTYRAQAATLGISDRMVFPGRIPYAEAPEWLSMGTVAMAPKLSITEGAGKIPLYMAMGLPTVAFDTPVSREFLGPLGIYAERGSVTSLAACIAEALDHPEASAVRGHELRTAALRDRSWNQAITRIEEVYTRALDWRASARFRGQRPLRTRPSLLDPD